MDTTGPTYERLDVDIGNVIINLRHADKEDGKFYEEIYSTIPAVTEAMESLRELADKRFGTNVFLLSKCTAEAEEKIRAWLRDNHFYDRVGVNATNVH